MSGDVQPRKRKDKKKKKDELSLDEQPRGTAAALGEGDVFMHSQSDHGTGGHWCAKIIFFALLAVLISLIGLIILENRGLSELEANAVESRYSGILEGWLEDAPDDDHHDQHTLELKHHDAEEEEDAHDLDHHDEQDHDDDDDDDEQDHDDDDEQDDDEDDDHGADEDETLDPNEDLDEADDEDEDDRVPYKYYAHDDDDEEKGDEDEEEEQDDGYETEERYEEENPDNDDEDDEQNEDNALNYEDLDESEEHGGELEERDDDDDEMKELDDESFEENTQIREEEDEHEDEEEDEDDELEVEKIEKEASEEDQDPISNELPALPEEDDDDDEKGDDDDEASEGDQDDEVDDGDEQDDNDDDYLENVPPVVERITAPAGKPYKEVEEDDDDSTEKPPNTLEEEEEYEKRQEQLRREKEQSSHMWLKLSVGAALLVATYAVISRATAPRDEPEEERVAREATPIDRRMTLIPEQAEPQVVSKQIEERMKPIVEEVFKQGASVVKAAPVSKQDSEEEVEEIDEPEAEEEEEVEEAIAVEKDDEKAELYSDEEVEEEEIERIEIPKKAAVAKAEPPKRKSEPEPEPEDEVPDDVEIIEDEEIEEDISEEEEVSDVDDTELLSRLEAKYGRLPEPDRPGQKHKDGGNSLEDDWPGEPADTYWRQQLNSAEEDLRQGEWTSAWKRASAPELAGSGRARYLAAVALDRLAEAQRDNRVLSRAIAAYLEVLKMNENLSDKKLLEVAKRTLDRIQFRGTYLSAEPVYRLLIRRFPNEPAYRNNLTVSFLMGNRADLAEGLLKETLQLWPDDRVALAHYAFVLKVNRNKYEEAVKLFEKALEGDKGPACEPRFYYHYGDALLLLGRYKEAHEVHVRGAKHGHFLSPAQRSLYNVPRLRSKPWWDVKETPYAKLAEALEKSWKEIRKEGKAAQELYEQEQEGLRERGEWSQMDLFVRGMEVGGRCARAPVTCGAVRAGGEGCRRGQVKFSAMAAGTHVRPHVGPTNCRLRMHLALANTKDTYLRVDQETRQWQEGKVLLFDDSFEHEVWHNGTGTRLILIVDVWHPDLTPHERRTLPAI